MELTVQRNLKTPIREQIVSQIVWQVASGRLASGAALPSIRALSRQLGVHHNTCLQAYRKLSELGIIQLRHGSGARVLSPPEIPDGVIRTAPVWPSNLQPLELLAQDFVIRVFTAGYPWKVALRALRQAKSLLAQKTGQSQAPISRNDP
jgi:DNA-binding transcriptional regulator YhcF (GntR family)